MAFIDVISGVDDNRQSPPDTKKVRKYAADILASKEISDYEVNIIFIEDNAMRELNETYKHQQGTTDVLSFNISDDPDTLLEGEVYVSLPRAAEQAEERGLAFEEEVIRLITHGLLHLSGRTHDTQEDLNAMNSETERFVDGYFGTGGHQ